MSEAARKLLEDSLALPEDERLQLASEIIASVDGPRDPDWESAWLAELDQRSSVVEQETSEWADVRSRVLQRLRRA